MLGLRWKMECPHRAQTPTAPQPRCDQRAAVVAKCRPRGASGIQSAARIGTRGATAHISS
jgi:hypothetical protein